MGWVIGVEPTTSRATTWHSNQLSYTHHMYTIKKMARLKGFEPLALCLEGRCSIQLSYRRVCDVERVMGIEPTQPAWKAGALPLSYTRIYKRGPILSGNDYLTTDVYFMSSAICKKNTEASDCYHHSLLVVIFPE